MNKFCTNCGHELKPEEKFCPSCGFNTESVKQAKESVSNTQNVNSYQNTNQYQNANAYQNPNNAAFEPGRAESILRLRAAGLYFWRLCF